MGLQSKGERTLSGGCGVMGEVGSKRQRCRMQHAGEVEGGTHALGCWAQHGEARRPLVG